MPIHYVHAAVTEAQRADNDRKQKGWQRARSAKSVARLPAVGNNAVAHVSFTYIHCQTFDLLLS